MLKPRLWNVSPSHPFRPLVDALNQSVKDQTPLTTNSGFGFFDGPFGRVISRVSEFLIVGVAPAGGIDAATVDDAGNRTIGVGQAIEQTLSIGDDGSLLLVPNGDPSVTTFTCVNFSRSSVAGNALIVCIKLFGLWFVIWEDCGSSDGEG